MTILLFILPLCLFTTFSTKRAGNLKQLISSNLDAHLHVSDEDEKSNNIRRRSVLLDNIFMLTLIDDDGSGSLKSRQLLSGLPGSFSPIVTKKNAPIHTENHYTEIYTDRPSQLFNKGSPENKKSIIKYYTTDLKITACLFRLLHQYYSLPTLFSKTTSSLLNFSRYPAIIELQPFSLSHKMRLRVSKRYTFYKKRLDIFSGLTVFKKIRPPP